MHIKVFGPGCARCAEAENVVKAAVKAANLQATVEKVSDLKEMMRNGIMSTPAIAIEGKIMCTGRVPDKTEVMAWLAAANPTMQG